MGSLSPSFITEIVPDCTGQEAEDVLEMIEQVMPMSIEGRTVLKMPLREQIRIARLALA